MYVPICIYMYVFKGQWLVMGKLLFFPSPVVDFHYTCKVDTIFNLRKSNTFVRK